MYNLTRDEASQLLGISTRSIDRYIKSGRLRIKKQGKNIFVNKYDVESLNGGDEIKQEIIGPTKIEKEVLKSAHNIDEIYLDLKKQIFEGGEKIIDLSFKLGKMEEALNNSISIIEFKKAQLLLEETKVEAKDTIKKQNNENIVLKKQFKEEKYANLILIIISLILFVLLAVVWYSKI